MAVILRVARVGLAAALLVALGGWAGERLRYGADDRAALERVEREVRQLFDSSAEMLRGITAAAAAEQDSIRDAARDTGALRRLFERADAAIPVDQAGRTGVTIYDAANAPIAWAGRVLDLSAAQLQGASPLVIASSALGPRLVRIDTVDNGAGPPGSRLATIVAEQTLGTLPESPRIADTFVLATSIAPVTVRVPLPSVSPSSIPPPAPRPPGVDEPSSQSDGDRSAVLPRSLSFTIPGRDGAPSIEAMVSLDDVAAARERWRALTRTGVLSILAVTLLLCAAPALDMRRKAVRVRPYLGTTVSVIAALLVARVVLWYAAEPIVGSRTLVSPVDLLLTALATSALAWLAIDVIERRRVTSPRPRVFAMSTAAAVAWAATFAVAGMLGAWVVWLYERILQRIVSHTDVDLLHFSVHPVSTGRLELAFALLLLDAAVVWSAAAMIRVPALVARPPRRRSWYLAAAAAWLAGVAFTTLVTPLTGSTVPLVPLWIAMVAAGGCAVTVARVGNRLRRASQAARLVTLFVAVLVPALALYPSLFAHSTEAKELLIAGEYAPQALRQREELKLRLGHTLDQIDAMPSLAQNVQAASAIVTSAQVSNRRFDAFYIWSMTDLATYRITSAVELYAADGRLLDRFASLPEYATARYFASGCNWEAFDEGATFGASVRHVLRASRGICVRGRPVGAIVVRAMLDYRTLPYISSQSPYLESLRPQARPAAEGVFGRDVEFVVYGWSRAPIYTSGTSAWNLPDDVFARLTQSREPFWQPLDRNGDTFRVYLFSDRGGIYGLGYPMITAFGHLINIAELVTLTGVLYAALVLGATLFNALSSRTPASGRALLREVRSSFYRKLFLAFCAVAVLPVAILAIVTRTYFAAQLSAGVEDSAAKTVTVAQRLVEDYASLQQRGSGTLTGIDDQIMVLVRRAIDEDVNLFDRERLQATSARDLFASQLISTRTPADVYRTILLERAPTFIGDEAIGEVRYRLAAAPVRAGGREGLVTVPLTSRAQEIEEQKDELDRRVLSAAVLFSLLGAAIGYWMAERIADPVNRLTRATRRIARGDLDARIAATSSDELRRLVQDFNQMAADLKRQRAELERTQRIEAWADMARQVAHDIKNPLTPIQLSAEHARRVNMDRGRPLSPVLDECVAAILTQVKLLRQISAEFSSFASSPTARPEPTALGALIEEVVEPYRMGLAGRIVVAVDVPPTLPVLAIDRTLFSRALTNIIENALHAMPGTGRLTISARLEPATDASPVAVAVDIVDTGIGMDADALSKIFEPYFSTKAAGTGLGLVIAKRNVELNGGAITVASQRGVGTTVTIRLPVG